jgi:hypothetical protein
MLGFSPAALLKHAQDSLVPDWDTIFSLNDSKSCSDLFIEG